MRPYPLIKHEDQDSKPDAAHPLFDFSVPTGLITADAPQSPAAPGGNDALKSDLDAMGVQYDQTEGHYGGPERSFIVYGLPQEQLYVLGKKYGQQAVIHSEAGQRKFIYTNGPDEGQYHPGLDTYEHWSDDHQPEDYYTRVPGNGYVRLHFSFDQKHPVAVMPPAPAAQAPSGAVPARAAAAPVTKGEIGYALYQALRKMQDGLAPGARPFPHPHAYPWHDGHTDHHYKGYGPGGVLISRTARLAKHDAPGAPVKHPHVDGAVPTQHPTNDQAAGAGVKSYGAFALPFGHIDHDAKARGGSNLFHYDYHGKNDAVNKLVADHGFQTYYAGGKFGKPDLANRNYNTKHLMVYDPTPQSGSNFGDQQYTDSWRKTHELAHALTYPDVNKLYGEGRRIGKLGYHRTTREALRAVHWEWLAAHKQRELNRSLGIDVPDEVFNRETNTVMHDAAHRAVTGKFTEPSQEGFTPHSHLVPLETSLGMVREHARGLGLQGEHDLLRKSLNLTDLESTVAEDEKFTVPEALAYLAKGARERVAKFEQDCLALRKAELAKTEKRTVSPLRKSATTLGPRGGSAGAGSAAPATPPPPPASTPRTGSMLPGELAKHEAMCKCEGCGRMDHFAKGELKLEKNDFSYSHCKTCGKSHEGSKTVLGHGKSKEALAADTDASDREYQEQRSRRRDAKLVLGKDEEGMADDAGPMGKTELPAGASPTHPGEKVGEKKNNPVKAGVKEQDIAGKGGGGSDGLASKKAPLAKAALPGAGGAAAPTPKPGGGAPLGGAAKPPAMGGAKPGGMKLPKLPGAKHASPAAPKTPPMGAGSPQAQVQKAELRKDLTWDPKSKPTGSTPSPWGVQSSAPAPKLPKLPHKAGGQTLAKATYQVRPPAPRPQPSAIPPSQAAGVKASSARAGAMMDNMLGSGQPAQLEPGHTLPAKSGLHPALAAAGQVVPPPAQGVQTMTERVASKGASPAAALTPPAPAAKAGRPKLPHLAAKK